MMRFCILQDESLILMLIRNYQFCEDTIQVSFGEFFAFCLFYLITVYFLEL